MRYFTLLILHDRIITLDNLVRKMSSMVGPFYCILCWKAEEELDHILWWCEFASYVWDFFSRHFAWCVLVVEMPGIWSRSSFLICRLRRTIVFLGLLVFVLLFGFCGMRGITWCLGGLREIIVNPICHQASISKFFCNYSMDMILYSWSPFLLRDCSFLWALVFLCPCILLFCSQWKLFL